ncbi:MULTISPECIES: hypothetical protein [Paenibacillus]|uniref:hypothetical protein n=1 Tax=Paenibacillus TaxID=44249 RepID=UPI000B9FDC96|nr:MULTISPECIES: hypothetical protein [Paenibacillus]OZQ60434.1 hypothetical protein CA599_30255 [Paenibacillus taichungensis]
MSNYHEFVKGKVYIGGADAALSAIKEQGITDDSGFPVCYGEKGMLSVTLCCDIADSSILRIQGGVASNSVPGYAELIIRRDKAAAAKLSILPSHIQYSQTDEEITLFAVGKSGHAAFPQGTSSAIAILLEPLLRSTV